MARPTRLFKEIPSIVFILSEDLVNFWAAFEMVQNKLIEDSRNVGLIYAAVADDTALPGKGFCKWNDF